jgi:hypothetical protein
MTTKPWPPYDFVMRVLIAFAMSPHDLCEELSWRVDGQYAPITFLVNCSDTFAWATADCEPLTPETIDVFEQVVADIRAAVPDDAQRAVYVYAAMLYAARQRGMRPMREAYPREYVKLAELLDACGPAR